MLSNALYFLTAAVVAAGVMAAPAERASHDCGPLVPWQFCNPYTPKQFTGQYTIRPVLNWQLAVTSPWADGSMWSTLILCEPSLVNQSFWLDGTGKATQIQYKNYNPPQPPPPGTPLCIGSGLSRGHRQEYIPSNGFYVELYPCDSPAGVTWKWDACTRQIKSTESNFCIDVTDGRAEAETHLQIWDCHGPDHPDVRNQQFNLWWDPYDTEPVPNCLIWMGCEGFKVDGGYV